ncbi:putative leucine-rich repeat and calponin-likey domain-containing protein 1 isoform X2 [Penaeus vannamei]|uniref:Putative leucine-rich repeat and calponin-likey domain-containing protein 1 isoform X2 n=1 Tax=Penaeus vannamei TaxID=6689 RepID=A0A3R7QVA0_PENVA|nr:putative leucine-rich repeat and calponin-likey domain-containing protein 1 isoform X2 [Penaeus vannamei]
MTFPMTRYLSKNRFSELPPEVTEYTSLEQLNLYQNVIKHLPESVINLQSLTHLNLSRNQLSVVPSCVCRLTSLRVLDLSGNRLVSLPEEVGNLYNLLDDPQPAGAPPPPALGELDMLRRLNLRRNLLQTIPSELCFLRLVLLDLSGNRIAMLPTELRFMSSLVTLSLDNNPLQHPPANLCTRGRVHIFKWLEMTAAKEDKKRGVLSEAEFRKLRKPSSATDFRFVNGFFDPRHKRSTMDSGYSTSENGDQRWSQESQESLEYEDSRKLAVMAATCTKEQRQERGRSGPPSRSVNGLPNGGMNTGVNGSQGMNGSGYGAQHSTDHPTSGLSTPSTLSPGDGFNLEDEFNKALKLKQDYENVYGSDHSPVKEREYVEAKLQKRAMENNNIYRRQGSEGNSPTAENGTHRSVENISHRSEMASYPRPNPMGASKPPCNGLDGYSQRLPSQPRPQDLSREDMTRADVKNIQKEAVLSYVKSRVSPSKGSASNSPDVSFDSGDGPSYPQVSSNSSHLQHNVPHATSFSSSPYTSQNVSYPISAPQASSTPFTSSNNMANPYPSATHQSTSQPSTPHASTYASRGSNGSLPKTPSTVKARKRSGGGRPFDPDASPAHLNFTYRREMEKQQHEKQLIENLRNIIESRLKVSLPADLSAALMDGVVLCHLANHVRPRSVSSIHVPSPAVPKLTIAKCRLNVENFLEACRKIGVEDDYTCSAHDILEERGTVRVAITVERLLQFYQGRHAPMSPRNQTPV